MARARARPRARPRARKAVRGTGLAHAAALLQILFTIIGALTLLGISTFAPLSGYHPFIGFIGFIGLIFSAFWSWVDYSVIYEQMDRGNYAKVSAVMLVSGLLQLIFGGFITGVMILIAWALARSG